MIFFRTPILLPIIHHQSVELDVMPSRVLCWWAAALIETDRGHEQRRDTIMASHTVVCATLHVLHIMLYIIQHINIKTFYMIYCILQRTAVEWIKYIQVQLHITVHCLRRERHKRFPILGKLGREWRRAARFFLWTSSLFW